MLNNFLFVSFTFFSSFILWHSNTEDFVNVILYNFFKFPYKLYVFIANGRVLVLY